MSTGFNVFTQDTSIVLTMSSKGLSQYLPTDLFLKSAVVEKNPDKSFRELVADFFGVSPEDITKIQRTGDAKGWDIYIRGLHQPSLEDEDYQWDLGEDDWVLHSLL